MEYKEILVERYEKVMTIKINRPEAMNSLNTDVLKELDEAVRNFENDHRVHVLIITGEGKAFVAGADIKAMSTMNLEEGRKFGAFGQEVFRRIERMEKPSIAAVNGFALGGGCELALCCDIRIASQRAKFGQPEVGLGITPGFSGTQRLSRVLGAAKAKELILTGDIIGAKEALELRLVNKLVEPDDLLACANEMATKIANNGPLAVRYSNLAIKRGLDTDIDTGIAIEAEFFGMCFATQDQKEGMKAFLEKRTPAFKGK